MDLIDVATKLGVAPASVLLVLAAFGLYRKWWVPGWVYQEELEAKIWWRGVAVKALNISESILPKGGA